MQESVRKTIEFLCTPEGKEAYKQALAEEKRGASENDILWDRLPGYALQTIADKFGAPEFDNDDALDWFGYSTKRLNADGDYIRWSTIPQLIAVTTQFETMAKHFGKLLSAGW